MANNNGRKEQTVIADEQ